jgi:hypothetical protein
MPTQKLDLYKEHKDEYVTPKTPTLVKIGRAKYLTIVGQGEPGGKVFSEKLGALYAVAFTLKMRKKFAGRDYRVCAMEGLWWGSQGEGDFMSQPRETWQWKIVIRTPDFVQRNDLAAAVAELLKKGKPSTVREVQLEAIAEGQCVQMLHVGPYATETATIDAMKKFATERGLVFYGLHHEIYLSDPRRVPPERLRTILRLPVKRAARQ